MLTAGKYIGRSTHTQWSVCLFSCLWKHLWGSSIPSFLQGFKPVNTQSQFNSDSYPKTLFTPIDGTTQASFASYYVSSSPFFSCSLIPLHVVATIAPSSLRHFIPSVTLPSHEHGYRREYIYFFNSSKFHVTSDCLHYSYVTNHFQWQFLEFLNTRNLKFYQISSDNSTRLCKGHRVWYLTSTKWRRTHPACETLWWQFIAGSGFKPRRDG